MENYKNLKKGTKAGLVIVAVLCIVMLAFLSINLFRANPPVELSAPPENMSTAPFVMPQSFSLIWDMAFLVLLLLYAFVGYKKPHGNMLRGLFFLFAVYLLVLSSIDFMMKSQDYIANGLVAFTSLLMAYVSGRLNKIEKNKVLLILAGIMLLVAEILSLVTGPMHMFDIVTIICKSTSVVTLAALGFAYTARYEQHKEAGLEDKQ